MPSNRSYFSLLLRVLTLVCVALLICYSAPIANKLPARAAVGLGLGTRFRLYIRLRTTTRKIDPYTRSVADSNFYFSRFIRRIGRLEKHLVPTRRQ
jgi:hypothetical protein